MSLRLLMENRKQRPILLLRAGPRRSECTNQRFSSSLEIHCSRVVVLCLIRRLTLRVSRAENGFAYVSTTFGIVSFTLLSTVPEHGRTIVVLEINRPCFQSSHFQKHLQIFMDIEQCCCSHLPLDQISLTLALQISEGRLPGYR
jgi:hypothetical protein